MSQTWIRFLWFGIGGVVAITVVVAGVMFWRVVNAPVPDTPCPATTLDAIEARGQSFQSSFFTSQYTVEGMIVRGVSGGPDPDCKFFLGVMRCEVAGPAMVGARLLNTAAYYDVPADSSAAISVSSSGIACGLTGEPTARGSE